MRILKLMSSENETTNRGQHKQGQYRRGDETADDNGGQRPLHLRPETKVCNEMAHILHRAHPTG
jgi:hypothetical protein